MIYISCPECNNMEKINILSYSFRMNPKVRIRYRCNKCFHEWKQEHPRALLSILLESYPVRKSLPLPVKRNRGTIKEKAKKVKKLQKVETNRFPNFDRFYFPEEEPAHLIIIEEGK